MLFFLILSIQAGFLLHYCMDFLRSGFSLFSCVFSAIILFFVLFLTKKYLLASLMSGNSSVRIDLDGELIPYNLYFSCHFSFFVMLQGHCFL